MPLAELPGGVRNSSNKSEGHEEADATRDAAQKEALSKKFQKKTQLEHILLRPGK